MTATLARVSFPALGTTATVVVAGPIDVLEAARRAVEVEVDAIDCACSRFRSDSELSRLNAAGGHPVAVSPQFQDAVIAALRAARLTEGLVDPTIGRALRLLGYDRDFAAVSQDGPAGSVVVQAVPGWQAVVVDPARCTVTVPAGVELDLGATAKALTSDRAARAAHRVAGVGVLVSLGGDVAMAGPPPPTAGWSVRVTDDHAGPPDAPGQTVALTSGGLATSGITARRWRRGDQSLHHLVDPRTGRPARAVWRTASVTAGTCLDANIASTAAILLGARAPAWLSQRGLPARLVSLAGATTLVCGWPEES